MREPPIPRASPWRAALLRLGRARLVALIVVASVGLSVATTLGAFGLSGKPVDLVTLGIAFGVPLAVSWPIGLLITSLLFELEATRLELYQLATCDALTKVYNRRYWCERLEEERVRARRQGHPLAVILIDIDHFKAVNDAFGHASGDHVLLQVAQTIKQSLRPYDLLSRYGGEEFAVMLSGVGQDTAMHVAERIRAVLSENEVALPQRSLRVTASLGVSSLRETDADGMAMMNRADAALYRAKALGRNRCHESGGPELEAEPEFR